MAAYFWVGGSGTWDNTTTTNWASTSGGAGGAGVPTSADTADFDANSGTAATVTVAATAVSLSATVNKADINLSLSGSPTLCTTAGTLTLTSGTITLNNNTLSVGIFSSSNSNTRAISFGSGNIALTSVTAAAAILVSTSIIGFSWTGTGGFTRNQAATASIGWGTLSGGTAARAVNFTVTAGASQLTINSGSYINNLIFTGSTCTVTSSNAVIAGNLTLATGGTYTSLVSTFINTSTVTSSGKTLGSTTVNAASVTLADAMTLGAANTLTLTAGTLNLAGFTLSCGIFSSNNSNTRAITFGSGNIALISTTAATTVLSMATVTSFTWTGTGGFTRNMAATATMVFGTTGGTASNAPNLTVNAGASALSVSAGSYFKNVDFTGSTSTVTATYNACGNLTLATGGTYTALSPTFRVSGTITSNGKTLSSVTINGTGIAVTLADAMTLDTNGAVSINEGTLNLNNFTLSCGRLTSGFITTTRSLDFGSGNIYLTSTTASTSVLLIGNATNFTSTGTGGFIRNQVATATISSNYNSFNLTVNGGSAALTINNYVKNLDFTGSTCAVTGNAYVYGNLTLATGGDYTNFNTQFYTISTITTNGNNTLGNVDIIDAGSIVTLNDNLTLSATKTFTITNGTLNLAGLTLSCDIFSSSNFNTRSIVFGSGSIALTSTVAGTTVLDIIYSDGFTWTGTGGFTRNMAATATVSFGSASSGGTPANAPNFTVIAGASDLTITSGSYFKNVNFTGSTSTVSGDYYACGNLTLATGGTYTAVVPTFLASGTVTSAGKTLGDTTVNGAGITVTLADAFSTTGVLTVTQGTFAAVTFAVTTGTFASSNTNTRTISLGANTWTITGSGATAWDTSTTTGLTVTPGTSTISMTSATAKTFAGGGTTYYNLNQGGAGALTISGSNTFNNITNTTQPATVTFTASTTQTVSSFGLSGTAGNLITINSSTAGTQATLSKATGTVTGQYLSITDSNATGGASWYAQARNGNTNGGNNTGWNFADVPITYDSSIAESSSATDVTLVAASIFAPQVSETSSATDTVLIAASTFGPQISESATATDTVLVAGSIFGSQVSEAATATDGILVTVFFGSQVSETSSATDTVLVAASIFGPQISETATATDATSVAASIFGPRVQETSTATDSPLVAPSVFNVQLADSAAVTDAVIGAFLWNLIDDSQSVNWVTISNPQSSSWTGIDDSQNPNWQNTNNV